MFIVFRIDVLPIFAPSWPPTWGHLGSQDASKFETWFQLIGMVLPKRGSEYDLALSDSSIIFLASIFEGLGRVLFTKFEACFER